MSDFLSLLVFYVCLVACMSCVFVVFPATLVVVVADAMVLMIYIVSECNFIITFVCHFLLFFMIFRTTFFILTFFNKFTSFASMFALPYLNRECPFKCSIDCQYTILYIFFIILSHHLPANSSIL